MCQNFGYECSYRSVPRRRRQRSTVTNDEAVVLEPEDPSPGNDSGVLVSLESNSGSAFVQRFAMTVDPSNTPPPRMLAWNLFLGERSMLPLTQVLHANDITQLLTQANMQDLARVYFEKVDPCYGFIDRQRVEDAIRERWLPSGECTLYDAVLAAIGAIGCLFSTLMDLQTETGLFTLVKTLLGLAITEEATVTLASGWVLRAVYLRLTGLPEEAWMTSCTAIHIIDAAGLHLEPDQSGSSKQAGRELMPDARRRLLGVATHLNVWMSFDLGRSRVILQNMSFDPKTIMQRPGDYTIELLELLPYCERLDPGKSLQGQELLTMLSEILDRTHSEPPSILAQTNLMLCVYRRLYTSKTPVPKEALVKAVSLVRRGITAVHNAMAGHHPWHHVANVPFQCICTLLAIDTEQSFSLLADSMSCLETVSQVYGTKATNDAVDAAHFLIYIHQKRREADVRRQSELLKLYPSAQTPQEDILGNLQFNEFGAVPWFNDLIYDANIPIFGGDDTFNIG